MFELPVGRPAVMGVLNVTPDSFSDGGRYLKSDLAIEHALAMMDDGADIVDVGGESTRPGASPVEVDEELRRVLPVIKALAGRRVPVSIDTSKSEVAEACLSEGVQMVNDVTALGDPRTAELCARYKCSLCLMHMQGNPRTMQSAPHYDDVVQEVTHYLLQQAEVATSAGVDRRRIWIDPGIGFGKKLEHNLALLSQIGALVATGFPVLIGVSRKSFLGKLLHTTAPEERLEGSLAIQALAQSNGIRGIRTHDVKATRLAVDAVVTLMRASSET